MHRLALPLALLLLPLAAVAQDLVERPGWRLIPTQMTYPALLEAVKTATTANGMGVVTEAVPRTPRAPWASPSRATA